MGKYKTLNLSNHPFLWSTRKGIRQWKTVNWLKFLFNWTITLAESLADKWTSWLTELTDWLVDPLADWIHIYTLTHCGLSMWKWAIWLMITCITCQWGYHGQFRYRISMLNSCMNETQLWDQCQTPECYRCIACGFFNVEAMTVK